MSPIVAWGIVAGVTLGFGLWTLASLAPRMSRPRLARRVAPYLIDISAGAREAVTPAPPGPLPVIGLLLEPIASKARQALGSLLGGSEAIARRLRQAGSPRTVEGSPVTAAAVGHSWRCDRRGGRRRICTAPGVARLAPGGPRARLRGGRSSRSRLPAPAGRSGPAGSSRGRATGNPRVPDAEPVCRGRHP